MKMIILLAAIPTTHGSPLSPGWMLYTSTIEPLAYPVSTLVVSLLTHDLPLPSEAPTIHVQEAQVDLDWFHLSCQCHGSRLDASPVLDHRSTSPPPNIYPFSRPHDTRYSVSFATCLVQAFCTFSFELCFLIPCNGLPQPSLSSCT